MQKPINSNPHLSFSANFTF